MRRKVGIWQKRRRKWKVGWGKKSVSKEVEAKGEVKCNVIKERKKAECE
jgi:hypothetical protein